MSSRKSKNLKKVFKLEPEGKTVIIVYIFANIRGKIPDTMKVKGQHFLFELLTLKYMKHGMCYLVSKEKRSPKN